MSPIDWVKLLAPYPGETIREKIHYARQGKTFRQLAEELIEKQATVKAAYYRFTAGAFTGKRHIVYSRIREDYAAIVQDLISSLAKEMGMTEEDCRKWIQTKEGEKAFLIWCAREGGEDDPEICSSRFKLLRTIL